MCSHLRRVSRPVPRRPSPRQFGRRRHRPVTRVDRTPLSIHQPGRTSSAAGRLRSAESGARYDHGRAGQEESGRAVAEARPARRWSGTTSRPAPLGGHSACSRTPGRCSSCSARSSACAATRAGGDAEHLRRHARRPPALDDRPRPAADQPYREGGRSRQEYRLTERGADTWRLLLATWNWERDWEPREVPLPAIVHRVCGAATEVVLCCAHCGVPVGPRDTEVSAARS